MATRMLVALAQLQCLEGEKDHNLQIGEAAIATAAGRQAGLVVLPELLTTGFLSMLAVRGQAEALDGPSVTRLAQAAAVHKIAVVTSVLELGEAGVVHNTAVFIDERGQLRGSYRKSHLFAAERSVYAAGERLDTVVTYKGVRFGLLICFDIEFPEAARHLALLGVDCILVPTANMTPYGHRHRVFAAARALENHVYVAYCNRCGSSREFEFPGESVLVDPLGRNACEADAAPTLVCGEVDLDVVAQSKTVFDYLTERRPKLYGARPT
jgi:5-aminopentanamidase